MSNIYYKKTYIETDDSFFKKFDKFNWNLVEVMIERMRRF